MFCTLTQSHFAVFYFEVLYSQVHKYWEIDTILIFLVYTTTMDLKLNKQDVQDVLSALI